MKHIEEFFERLSNDDLFSIYNNEYLKFKNTGVIPLDGQIRELCKVNSEYLLNGRYDIDFAIKLFLEEWSAAFIKLKSTRDIL